MENISFKDFYLVIMLLGLKGIKWEIGMSFEFDSVLPTPFPTFLKIIVTAALIVCFMLVLSHVTHQASLTTGSPRKEYWSGLPYPLQGISLIQELNPHVLCLLHWQADSLPLSCHLRSTNCTFNGYKFFIRYWCPREYLISMKSWIRFKNFTLSSVLADFELINIKVFLLSVKTTSKEDY